MRALPFLLATVLVAPLVSADPEGSIDLLTRTFGVASRANGALDVAYVEARSDRVLARAFGPDGFSGAVEVLSPPQDYRVRDLHVDGAGGHLAVVSLLWPKDDAPMRPALAYVSVRAAPDAPWTTRVLPAPPGGSEPNPWAAAQSPDGTTHVVQTSLAGTFLTSGKDGAWTHALVSESLGFPDVVVGADGAPHVCATQGVDLIEWTPAGATVMRREGTGGAAYLCVLAADVDGGLWAGAATVPLVGGSCIALGVCLTSPDAGRLVVLQREAAGEWTATPSSVPFYGEMQATTTAAGARYLLHYGPDGGTAWHVYRVAGDGALSAPWTPDAWEVAVPRQSPAPPLLVGTGAGTLSVQAFPAFT